MTFFLYPAAAARLSFHELPGRPPTLAFIHSLGASAAQGFGRASVLPSLSEHRRLLIDLFGFGDSDAPAEFSYSIEDHAASVAALLEALGLRDAFLVGHSMGGAVAIALATTRPDLVTRLALVEAHLDPVVGSISGAVLAASEEDFARRGQAALASKLASEGSTSYAAAVESADPAAMYRSARSLVAPRRPTFRDMLVNLGLPRFFLLGGRNAADPDVRWLPAYGIPVHVIPGAGHDIMNDQPDAFAAALSDLTNA